MAVIYEDQPLEWDKTYLFDAKGSLNNLFNNRNMFSWIQFQTFFVGGGEAVWCKSFSLYNPSQSVPFEVFVNLSTCSAPYAPISRPYCLPSFLAALVSFLLFSTTYSILSFLLSCFYPVSLSFSCPPILRLQQLPLLVLLLTPSAVKLDDAWSDAFIYNMWFFKGWFCFMVKY